MLEFLMVLLFVFYGKISSKMCSPLSVSIVIKVAICVFKLLKLLCACSILDFTFKCPAVGVHNMLRLAIL